METKTLYSSRFYGKQHLVSRDAPEPKPIKTCTPYDEIVPVKGRDRTKAKYPRFRIAMIMKKNRNTIRYEN